MTHNRTRVIYVIYVSASIQYLYVHQVHVRYLCEYYTCMSVCLHVDWHVVYKSPNVNTLLSRSMD